MKNKIKNMNYISFERLNLLNNYSVDFDFIEKNYNEKELYFVDDLNSISTDNHNYLKNLFDFDDRLTILDLLKFFNKWFNIRIFATQKISGEFGFVIFIQTDNPAAKPFERFSPFTYSSKTYNQALNDGIKYVLKNKILIKQIYKMIKINE